MAARNRRYPIDMSNSTERFLDCSPRMNRDGEQALTPNGLPTWTVHTLEDVQYADYATTDDKQQVVLAASRPLSLTKYTPVRFVNPVISYFSFLSNRGERVSGLTIYVDDVVAVGGDAE